MCLRLALLSVLLLFSTRSISHSPVKKTAMELITQQEWLFAGAGYDENRNGFLDKEEAILAECESDNSCLFLKNGTGVYYDNRLICGTGVTECLFRWGFVDKNRSLILDESAVRISCLNEDNLVFFGNTKGAGGREIIYITVFMHASVNNQKNEKINNDME